MSVALGLALGAGLVLLISPRLWPASSDGSARDRGLTSSVHDHLTHAGLAQVSVSSFLAVSGLVGLAAGVLVEALLRVDGAALAAAATGLLLPWAVVGARSAARRGAHREVWPDVVDHLVSAVRAGMGLPDAVASLADAGPAVLRPAFRDFASVHRTTGSFAVALDELKDQLADPTADRILETLRMAREVGGTQLPDVLRGLARFLREEAAIRSEAEARQSWVVNAAKLGVAAPWIILALLSTRHEAVAAYDTAAGTVVIVVGLVVSAIAYRLMLALGRLPEDRRWFA
ncbi:type II secretion system F family protein [Clavibacter michiganensis]|uniref:type II secretion system F family protein n=1 Tax=Clavibacter michiganensis TaxID=28447 RepID=UPI0013652942|nr:type II secretion system F family protein [Clavibacter michiganensis]MDO4121017.1 type II secretion system F family protein [Clavibacter michiganensis]MWJ00098.1 type II secretion system protein F [Clavibacter michiganensis subsp. michiganensis]